MEDPQSVDAVRDMAEHIPDMPVRLVTVGPSGQPEVERKVTTIGELEQMAVDKNTDTIRSPSTGREVKQIQIIPSRRRSSRLRAKHETKAEEEEEDGDQVEACKVLTSGLTRSQLIRKLRPFYKDRLEGKTSQELCARFHELLIEQIRDNALLTDNMCRQFSGLSDDEKSEILMISSMLGVPFSSDVPVGTNCRHLLVNIQQLKNAQAKNKSWGTWFWELSRKPFDWTVNAFKFVARHPRLTTTAIAIYGLMCAGGVALPGCEYAIAAGRGLQTIAAIPFQAFEGLQNRRTEAAEAQEARNLKMRNEQQLALQQQRNALQTQAVMQRRQLAQQQKAEERAKLDFLSGAISDIGTGLGHATQAVFNPAGDLINDVTGAGGNLLLDVAEGGSQVIGSAAAGAAGIASTLAWPAAAAAGVVGLGAVRTLGGTAGKAVDVAAHVTGADKREERKNKPQKRSRSRSRSRSRTRTRSRFVSARSRKA